MWAELQAAPGPQAELQVEPRAERQVRVELQLEPQAQHEAREQPPTQGQQGARRQLEPRWLALAGQTDQARQAGQARQKQVGTAPGTDKLPALAARQQSCGLRILAG